MIPVVCRKLVVFTFNGTLKFPAELFGRRPLRFPVFLAGKRSRIGIFNSVLTKQCDNFRPEMTVTFRASGFPVFFDSIKGASAFRAGISVFTAGVLFFQYIRKKAAKGNIYPVFCCGKTSFPRTLFTQVQLNGGITGNLLYKDYGRTYAANIAFHQNFLRVSSGFSRPARIAGSSDTRTESTSVPAATKNNSLNRTVTGMFSR